MKKLVVVSWCLLLSLAMGAPAVADRDYRGQRGYHLHPYDTHRHYDHFSYRDHRYEYHGHWRSWNDWHAYRNRYPERYRYGHYYREHGHLMFRFCSPESGGCFFFSIGR